MAVIEINWQPSRRDLRIFAIVQLVMASVVAWLLHRRLQWDAIAIALVAVSLVILIVGLVTPQILRPLFIAWMVAAFPIGWLMSHVMLAIIYYGIITPIGLMLRLSGRDPLQLKDRTDTTSYRVTRPAPSEASRYFRQF